MNEELSIKEALRHGTAAHRAGRLKEADRYYTSILSAEPNHPDANHNMGVLAVDVGKTEASLVFFKKALKSNSSAEQYWLSYINALIRLNKLDEAQLVFTEAKENGFSGTAFESLGDHLNLATKRSRKASDP